MSKKEPLVELLDLRSITRDSHLVQATVWIGHEHEQVQWIITGRASLEERGNGRWNFSARCSYGVVDTEQDSAYAVNFDLIGVTSVGASSSRARYHGWIAIEDRMSGFNVPEPGYDPVKEPGAYKKKIKSGDFEDELTFVPNYLPPDNNKLFRKVYGQRVMIVFGPPKEAR